MPLLSVIVPVYNEARTIKQILEKINAVDIDKEMIVIDDGSYDGTEKILIDIKYNNLKIIHHSSNRGKGAAFLIGLSHANGEFIIIQDADLEYDPNDYLKLMEALKQDNADIVLSARFKKGYHGLLIHRFGNRLLTRLLNILFNLKHDFVKNAFFPRFTQIFKDTHRFSRRYQCASVFYQCASYSQRIRFS